MSMVVLAAGMGSRFGGPKQLVPVGPDGESILDLNVRHAADAGFERVVVVTRPELAGDVTRRTSDAAVDVVITLQTIPDGRTKPYGTAHAVATAAPHLDAAFGVCNADDLYGPEAFAALVAHMRAEPDDAGIVGFTLANTVPARGAVSRAMLRHDGTNVHGVVEVHGISRESGLWEPASVDGFGSIDGGEFVSMNLLALPHRAMTHVESAVADFVAAPTNGEVLLPDVVNDLLARDVMRIRLVTGAGQWVGLTNPDDLDVVRRHLASS